MLKKQGFKGIGILQISIEFKKEFSRYLEKNDFTITKSLFFMCQYLNFLIFFILIKPPIQSIIDKQ